MYLTLFHRASSFSEMACRTGQFASRLLGVASLALLCSISQAADNEKDGPTYTDPKSAGSDYALQGEFQGVIEKDENRTWGVQVIALGKDAFSLVGYPGGLPGKGYHAGDELKKAEGKRKGDVVEFEGDHYKAELTESALKISVDGELVATLDRVHRESPTLGKRPPAGAIVLFDGSSAEHFKGGKMTDEKLLMADTSSLETFGDHEMHIEFRTPFRPLARGQARGNSGVYVQSRYEIQVLDSFGLSGEDNECGGIYKNAKPKVNMCYPPLTWQTYDIDFKSAKYDSDGKKSEPARITVRHNGELIHEDLVLKAHTPGRLNEASEPQPLYLQGHGNPVVYQNIWAIKK